MTISIDLAKMITAEQRSEAEIAAAIASLKLILDNHLNAFAKDAGYDSIGSMATYAFSSIETFQAEGQKAIDYRDACWKVFMDLTKDKSNLPSAEELLDSLPAPV